VGGVAVSYPYRAIFPPLQGILCGRFFSQGCVFLRYRPRGRTGFPLAKACPPVSGGFSFSGAGGGLACASPQSDVGRASQGCFWGSPYQRRRRIFAVPRWGAFPPPLFGGVFIFCGLWHGVVRYLCGMEKRNRGGCPVVSAKNAVKCESGCFLLAFVRAPLRVQLGVLAGLLFHGCEVWLMLWPLLWA
jgi:hypothetical protein